MKPARLPLVLLLLAVLGSAQPVLAQRDGGGGRFLRERPAGAQRQMPPQRDEADARGNRNDGAGDGPRRQQLSPEERQQLRRDIHEAGRDIYHHDRPQRRMQRRQP